MKRLISALALFVALAMAPAARAQSQGWPLLGATYPLVSAANVDPTADIWFLNAYSTALPLGYRGGTMQYTSIGGLHFFQIKPRPPLPGEPPQPYPSGLDWVHDYMMYLNGIPADLHYNTPWSNMVTYWMQDQVSITAHIVVHAGSSSGYGVQIDGIIHKQASFVGPKPSWPAGGMTGVSF